LSPQIWANIQISK